MTPTNRLLDRRTFLLGGGALFLAACSSSSSTGTAADPTADSASGTTGELAGAASTTVVPASTTASGTAASTGAGTVARQALWIPPAVTGPTFDLRLAPASKQLFDGAATATYGYNGADFWGPTLIMNKGDTVVLNVTNELDEITTTHWHGFHIPPEMDGGPHQTIAAGATWSPTFEVMNDASTYWYHPHMHETTWKQMNLGAGGLIIVQDDVEGALALPRAYGVDDIPLVLTSRKFGADNAIDTTGIYGDVMLTNGTRDAEVSLPAQLVRFRLLNAEIERVYDLGFDDDRTFHVIGTDGGLVNEPVPVTRLLLAPGERYEIVVDLGVDPVGHELSMQAFNGGQPFGFPGGEPNQDGTFGSLLNDTTFDVLHIVVGAATADAVTSLPATLAANVYWTAADASGERTIEINDDGPGTPFRFGDHGYEMDTIDQRVTLDATERWTIVNGHTFSHSFHIHDVQFSVVSRSTGAVPAYEQGWKDTVYVFKDETVSFVARFADFASTEHPFMYHCHMSNHEDEGLMGQFLVVPA